MNATLLMDETVEHARVLWDQARVIWVSGGWSMVAIATTALVTFALGMHVYLRLRGKRFRSVPEKTWRRWIDRPEERQGTIGRVLDFVTAGDSLKSTSARFEELRAAEVAPFERDLSVMKICVGVAPLLGLFGTVTGMLTTFSALASGSGGEKTMAMVAKGISEALVTTETGLVIALPGLFIHHLLARHHERYSAFLAHLETVCNQSLHLRRREVVAPARIVSRYVPVRSLRELAAQGEYVGVAAGTADERLQPRKIAAGK